MTKKRWIWLGVLLGVLIAVAAVVCAIVLGAKKPQNPNEPQGDEPTVQGEPDIVVEENAKLIYTLNEAGTAYTVTGVENKYVRNVEIPDTYEDLPVTAIADAVFEDVGAISSIKLGKNVETIGERAFYNCDGLTQLTLPDSLRVVGISAFSCSDSLEELTLGNGTKEIGYAAFSGCTALAKVAIPASVTKINEDAFAGCTSLGGVYITDLAAWCAIEFQCATANPLSVCGRLYLNNALLTELAFPASVTSIGAYAFYNADAITGVTIPADLRSIGIGAFAACDALKDATFAETAEWWAYETASAEAGTALTLPTAFAAAECLTDTYHSYYWKRG